MVRIPAAPSQGPEPEPRLYGWQAAGAAKILSNQVAKALGDHRLNESDPDCYIMIANLGRGPAICLKANNPWRNSRAVVENVVHRARRAGYEAYIVEGSSDDHGWHPVTFEILLPPGVRVGRAEGPPRHRR